MYIYIFNLDTLNTCSEFYKNRHFWHYVRKKLKLGTLRKLLTLCPDKGSLLHFLNSYTAPNQHPKYSFSEQETKAVKRGRNCRQRREKKDRATMTWEWGIFCYVH